MKKENNYSNAPGDVEVDVVGLSSRARQGRQQNGDTYTLEIAFPAVKYVNENYKYFHEDSVLIEASRTFEAS